MANLVIVESPTKAKEVGHILGSNYVVRASMGHIRDLPGKELGVDLETFAPSYVPSDRGKKTIAQLKKLASDAEIVYLATDPDREGEAIAWHLEQALRLNKTKTKRVTYNEVTETAVKNAFKEARGIDYNMVRAQEARRVLDRLVGYVVSPALWESGQKGLSAGRVQSVALRLIVERDREIRSHNKRKHFGAVLSFTGYEPEFQAEWVTKPFANEDGLVLDRELAEKAASIKDVRVANYSQEKRKKNPSAPFTTSTLQQTANAKLNLPSSKTMQIAQKLFEAGRITYMRTDSVSLSEDAINNVRDFAKSKNLPLPAQPNQHAGKSANAQEAHECIRPTDMFFEGDDLDDEQRALYQLIHKQTLASQLAPALLLHTKITFKAVEAIDEICFEYVSNAVEIIQPGFMTVMGKVEETFVPALDDGSTHTAEHGKVVEKETKPPSHFTEGTLTAALEKKGIGRPATYASIIDNIKRKKYVVLQGKKLVATDLGDKLVQILRPSDEQGCTFMEYEFTSELEEKLDEIARGESHYRQTIGAAYTVIETDTEKVSEQIKVVDIAGASTQSLSGGKAGAKSVRRNKASEVRGEKTSGTLGQKTCPKCSKPLVRRNGKHGPFWGCTGFPECKHIENEKKAQTQSSEKTCPRCGKAMYLRNGAYGKFYGCSGFPSCKQTVKVDA